MSNVVINGTFDCLHAGHFRFIHWCWRFYSFKEDLPLIVGIDSDKKVKQDKGQLRPYFSQEERRKHVLETGFVDDTFFFDSNKELEEKIKELNPEYLIKDQHWRDNIVGKKYAKKIVIFDGSHASISTSKIEERIRKKILNQIKLEHPGVSL